MPVASRVPQTPCRSASPGTAGTNGAEPVATTMCTAVCRTPSTSTAPGAGQPAVPAEQVDAVLGQPALLAGVGVVGHHEVPPGQHGLDVDLRGGPGLACAVHRFARPQQGFRGNAGPVGALAADQFSLDDGHPQSPRGQGCCAVLAGRAAAENDDVVVRGILTEEGRGAWSAPVRLAMTLQNNAVTGDLVAPVDTLVGSLVWIGPGVHQ